jgi:hypothetical protein
MNLNISPKEIEFIYDELDTNAVNFQFDGGYFSIQTGVCLESEEDDDMANEPFFELNDQGNSQVGGQQEITFYENKIVIMFSDDNLFNGEFKTITIIFGKNITSEMVDFFNNYLFLGEYIRYDFSFPDNKKVIQNKYKIDYGDF